jgi:hypothetical protein
MLKRLVSTFVALSHRKLPLANRAVKAIHEAEPTEICGPNEHSLASSTSISLHPVHLDNGEISPSREPSKVAYLLRLTSTEDRIKQFHALEADGARLDSLGFRYDVVVQPDEARSWGRFVTYDDFSRALAESTLAQQTGMPKFSSGIITLHNWNLLGPCGIVFHPKAGIAFEGQLLGGTREFIRWHTETAFNASWRTDETFSFECAPNQRVEDPSQAILLAGPGLDIFGHWMLDYVPQISMMEDVMKATGVRYPYILPPVKPWAKRFLELMAPEATMIEFEIDRPYEVEVLQVPTFAKNGYILLERACREAWGKLRARVNPVQLEQTYEKVFISRTRWPVARPIANIDGIETLARQRGYNVIYPELLSLEEQAAVFRSARVIIGEDGSALHNVIFSEPGSALGIIGLPVRRNLWHRAICEVMGIWVTYMECDELEGDHIASETQFNNMLDALEAAVKTG